LANVEKMRHVRNDRENRCFLIAVSNTFYLRLAGYSRSNNRLKKASVTPFFLTMFFFAFSLDFLGKKVRKKGVTSWPFLHRFSG